MNLPGRLKRSTLGDLLGSLHREQASGVLELVEASGVSSGRKHHVYLSDGFVDGVHTELEAPRLGEVLHEQGLIDRFTFAALLRRLANERHRRAGEILVGERLATPASVGAALRFQLRARLDALFLLEDAFVRFHVRRPGGPGFSIPPLTAEEFLHGRPRARARTVSASAARGTANDGGVGRDEAYRTLGLEPGADATAVRRAFRRLAAEHHPDRHPRASSGQIASLVQRLSRITRAYHVLGP